ncbi:hypothetical protein CJ030_MR0G007880 [Morella rubra]|uniref:RING-type domain-containing protein n=1 Tax=Morella rubra TaxID=262757 RepID=A0A6A1UIW8_9ROSI|nr:hypothetical protein CJ030_MR0G007880 [Morella rubra]
MESPECPVCLESYDGACAIPRVLACGHTACEACLANLPQRFPQTVRCPACNQLVKYPAQGPSALPKNIDLLRLCNAQTTGPKSGIEINEHSSNYNEHHQFLPRFWSDEFYSLWKDCILSKDSVFVEPDAEAEDEEEDKVLCAVLGGGTALPSSLPVRPGFKENQRASLVRLVSLPSVSESSVFNYSYVAHIMRCLSGMEEEERNELGLILRASLERQRGNCKVYGLWSDLEGRFLYLVCEKQRGSLLEKFDVSTNGLDVGDGEGPSKNGMSSFALIGVEICEAVIALHLEGLVMGSGLAVGDNHSVNFGGYFGHVHVDFSGVVVAGRKVRRSVVEAVSGRSRINMDCLGLVFYSLLKREAFLSPELLLELLRKEGIAANTIGKLHSSQNRFWKSSFVEGSDYSTWYLSWVKKVSFLLEAILGSEYASSSQLLCKCLNLDPGSRPLAIDVRRCVRELLIKPQFDTSGSLEDVKVESTWRCLILGKLCQLPNRRAEIQIEVGEADLDRVDKNFVEGVSEGVIKFKDLQGHLDCITGLAVGGGFLFSSSFDKTIHVWSLQDFSHVNTFRGHEHRVMALVYVGDEQLCISADSGGGIFVWSSSFPLGQEPLKKWYEQKDWRYTGIHALTFFSGNGNLYTGSGDKAIKVWSVKYMMRVLYSGSWDGTIRLWSLNDHSPLAVLGEDVLGNVTSVSCNSDVWSLACVLMRLIIGKSFTEQILEISVEGSDYSTWYLSWVKKVSFLLEAILGSEYASSSQLLCKCLNLDPGSRPLAIDVRRCVRELLIKPQFDTSGSLEDVKVESTWRCLILGKLCQLPNRRAEIQIEVGEADLDRVDKNFVEGVSEGVIKFKDLQGHLDCITGLAVGGGFLFSSSFDKTIHVWSLQDFSHVNTFRGHEHRVMALVYVGDEQLCISADSGGGIFVWSSSFPLGQEPLKKWYEQKDWRYTGIHALTFFSGNGNLYTGSGDKAIKVWSVKNGTLSCTMDGHKSVVSTLAVHDGVLYSGSWDGTIRLWSLNDHSPLAVLGEDVLGNVTSVLSLAADRHMLVAAHENGCIKVWRNDELMKTTQVHNGAIFTTGMEGKWLFTGGWDKIVKVQELLGDEFQIDVIPTGSVPSGSVVTALLYWQGKLIVGHADRSIKVYHYGR